MYVVTRFREYRRNLKPLEASSLMGITFLATEAMLVVAAVYAAYHGSFVQAAFLVALVAAAALVFRVTTRDESYDRYVTATEVLGEMSEMVTELDAENIPLESKYGEDFRRYYDAAQRRASKRVRLTRDDMDYVALNTALAHAALEEHAAVESVEGD